MTNGSSSVKKPARLGRGLSALVGTNPPVQVPTSTPGASLENTKQSTNIGLAAPGSGLVMASVDAIRPNPQQPRRVFDDESLRALAGSIGRDGVMQPVVVRPLPDGGYELVAGERRLRASKLAGLERIPAIVREVDDRTSAELALIENLQRSDLNPVDRARAFRSLVDRYAMTQAEVADRVGMDRSSVANHLRLLDLDQPILDLLSDGRLGFGHARALLGVADPEDRLALAVLAAEESWSVRSVERAAAERQASAEGRTPGDQARSNTEKSEATSQPSEVNRRARAVLDDMERRLSEHLGTRVTLKTDRGGQKGSLTIEFFSLDQFDGLLDRMGYRHDIG